LGESRDVLGLGGEKKGGKQILWRRGEDRFGKRRREHRPGDAVAERRVAFSLSKKKEHGAVDNYRKEKLTQRRGKRPF